MESLCSCAAWHENGKRLFFFLFNGSAMYLPPLLQILVNIFLMCFFQFSVLHMCELHPYTTIASSPSLNFFTELNYVLFCVSEFLWLHVLGCF